MLNDEFTLSLSVGSIMASNPSKTKSKANQPIDGKFDGTILGPANPSREEENPDILIPPRTDAGTLANYKWSFADSHMRLEEGGWARQTTVRELPSAKTIAAVNMRLNAGAVRSDHYADISLAKWLAFTPNELVRAHLKIDESVLAKIPKQKTPIVPS